MEEGDGKAPSVEIEAYKDQLPPRRRLPFLSLSPLLPSPTPPLWRPPPPPSAKGALRERERICSGFAPASCEPRTLTINSMVLSSITDSGSIARGGCGENGSSSARGRENPVVDPLGPERRRNRRRAVAGSDRSTD